MKRTLTFRKRNRAPFGPAYARVTRTQTVSHLSRDLLVLESRTDVKGVPYSDKFHVRERWVVVRSAKTTTLTASAEVVLASWCVFEARIRSASIGGVTDFLTAWYEQAREAVANAAAEHATQQSRGELGGGEGAEAPPKRQSDATAAVPASGAAETGEKRTIRADDAHVPVEVSRPNVTTSSGSLSPEEEEKFPVVVALPDKSAGPSAPQDEDEGVLVQAEDDAAVRIGDRGESTKAGGRGSSRHNSKVVIRKLKKKCSRIRERVLPPSA